MPKLHQIVALVDGKKTRAQKLLTDTHHGWNAKAIMGITRRYKPLNDDGEKLPPETGLIQADVVKKLGEVRDVLSDYYNIVATQETANSQAVADVVVDSVVVLQSAPVGLIMFLKRQFDDLRALTVGLPTLPSDRRWTWDGNQGCFISDTQETIRTAKVPEVITLAQATPEHPAQAQVFPKDVTVGTWSTTHLSSALPVDKKDRLLKRVDNWLDALKVARESANSCEAENVEVAKPIFDNLFAGLFE